MYLHVRHLGTLFLRSSYLYLFKNIAFVRHICNFENKLYSCVCIFVFVYLHIRHSGTLFLRSMYHYLCENITYVRHICNFDQNCICVFVYLSICVFVIMYLHIRYLGTSFLKSSYHHLFKNIAHVVPMCNFDRSCICVFVHLCICIGWWWVNG